MPPLSGFFAKYGLVLAGLQAQAYAPVAGALAVSMLTLFSMVKIWIQGFMKRMPEGVYPQGAVEPLLSASAVALAACALAVAIAAGPLWNLAMQAAQQLLHPEGYIRAVLGG
jgi:multicomponent Na+:H+ antiporter subunit D